MAQLASLRVRVRACVLLRRVPGPQLEVLMMPWEKQAGGRLYNEELLSVSLHLSFSLGLSLSLSLSIQHARSSVIPSLRCQGCQSPTRRVLGNRFLGNRGIRLLGTWSCAHNSHFVACVRAHAQIRIHTHRYTHNTRWGKTKPCNINKFALHINICVNICSANE